jgi:hypothetical protein
MYLEHPNTEGPNLSQQMLDHFLEGDQWFKVFPHNVKHTLISAGIDIENGFCFHAGSNVDAYASVIHHVEARHAVIEFVKQHQYTTIVFNRTSECINTDILQCVNLLADAIHAECPHIKLWLVTGNYQDPQHYQHLAPNITVVGIPFYMFKHDSEQVDSREYSTDRCNYDFLFLNNKCKFSRAYLLSELAKENLVHNNLVSMIEWPPMLPPSCIDVNYELEQISSWCSDIVPLSVEGDCAQDNTFANTNLYNTWMYDQTWFSVVSETVGPYDILESVWTTEKTKKPILHKHPFLINGLPNTLQQVRDIGYKTFHPHIDETYDTIHNPREKTKALVKEIKRLCAFTDIEKKNFAKAVTPILDYNFELCNSVTAPPFSLIVD